MYEADKSRATVNFIDTGATHLSRWHYWGRLNPYSTRNFCVVIQAPTLVQRVSRVYFKKKKVHYPAENPRWLPVF